MGGLPPTATRIAGATRSPTSRGPVFAPFNKFNTKCWDQTGTNYNPATNRISAIVFGARATWSGTFGYLHRRLRLRQRRQRRARLRPARSRRWPGRIGGPGATDLDFQRVKVAASAPTASSTSSRTTTGVTPSGTNQTIMYSGNSFTITSATGNVPGRACPLHSRRSTSATTATRRTRTIRPGVVHDQPSDGLPKRSARSASLNDDRRVQPSSAATSTPPTTSGWPAARTRPRPTDDALSGFVMVWLTSRAAGARSAA